MSRLIYELRHGVAYVRVICDVRRDLHALMLHPILDTNPHAQVQKGTPL